MSGSGVLHLARPEIVALAPYQPARWDPALVRLHANENPWRRAADTTRAGLNRYPEPQSSLLAERLADLYGVAEDQVLVGRGSDEGIDLLVRAFCRAGRDRILICPPTFGMYRFAADLQGAGVVRVPLRDDEGFALDPDGVLAACDETVKLVFLCSPNNPTGNLMQADAIQRMLAGLMGRALVVVDEAYVEFASSPSLVPWLARYPNLAILRTLSKAHALAGARCGAVLASPEIIGLLRRMIPPYALTSASIEAVLDALTPEALASTAGQLEALRRERDRVAARLERSPGIRQVWPSEGNFLMVRCEDAARMLAAGIAGGLLERNLDSYPELAGCLRMTVGTPQENDRLLAALEAA
jgi:histidinol-phosphate aminotransferase